MDILKKKLQNFPNNVINDRYKFVFSKLLCIVNISNYKKSCIDHFLVRGGEGQPPKQPPLQHLAVTVKIYIFRPNFSEKCDNSLNLTNMFFKCTSTYNKYIVHFLSKTLG